MLVKIPDYTSRHQSVWSTACLRAVIKRYFENLELIFMWRIKRDCGRLRLTVSLCGWAVRVAEGQQRRLHQLREENILPDQDKLGVLLSSFASVCLDASIRLLHHTEDRNHQTCGEKGLALIKLSGLSLTDRQRTCGLDSPWMKPAVDSSFFLFFYAVEYCDTWNSQRAAINQGNKWHTVLNRLILRPLI